MTEKLYYNDPFCKTFTATVRACVQEKDAWAVTLDRTAFYPEGGGQPADHGTLGGVHVADTRERDGEVVHLCNGPLAVGEAVEGAIDWARRFDFMQQHSGEHIVSGILCAAFHCDNVGFHIGHGLVTIDFNAGLTAEDVLDIERRANQYIWEDHALSVAYPSPEELEKLDYRSKKALAGQVRIVSWPGADCCACCGTHVLRSGQVGLVKLLSCQKFREGVRIEMAAGGRALDRFNVIAGQNTRVSQLLSAKPDATAAAVERLQAELYALRGRVAALEERDFARLARQYQGAGTCSWWSPPCPRNPCGSSAARSRTPPEGAVPSSPEGRGFPVRRQRPGGRPAAPRQEHQRRPQRPGRREAEFCPGERPGGGGEIARFFSALA